MNEMQEAKFDFCFRCYYENGNSTEHRQTLKLCEVSKWIECYQFTHPAVKSISIKIWFKKED